MNKDIIGFNNEKIGEIKLDPNLTKKDLPTGCLYYKFLNENANIHIGTAFKKNRSLVRGGGAKPWRQKHTGRARAGSRRSPVFVGGGVTFGGQIKNYKFVLPKKIKARALVVLFNLKFRNNKINVIDDIKLDSFKTKEFINLTKKLISLNEKCILIVKNIDEKLLKSTRNLKHIRLIDVTRIPIRELVNNLPIFITKSAVEYLNEFSKKVDFKDKKKEE